MPHLSPMQWLPVLFILWAALTMFISSVHFSKMSSITMKAPDVLLSNNIYWKWYSSQTHKL